MIFDLTRDEIWFLKAHAFAVLFGAFLAAVGVVSDAISASVVVIALGLALSLSVVRPPSAG